MDICIDFDGTCVKHMYPLIGEDIGAQKVLKNLVKQGHNLILFTMRSGFELDEAVKWFEENGIELYGINTHPKQAVWTQSPKAYGQLYIDDAALGVPLIYPKDKRAYVDWVEVERWLISRNILTEKIEYEGVICRGSIVLGNACGICEKCEDELNRLNER